MAYKLSDFELSDFEVGQTAYLELCGNAARRIDRNNVEAHIRTCVIKSVGRKYIVAGDPNNSYDDHKFEEMPDSSYIGLPEHTNCSVDYILYPNKQAVIDKVGSQILWLLCREKIRSMTANKLPLSKWQQIAEILEVDLNK